MSLSISVLKTQKDDASLAIRGFCLLWRQVEQVDGLGLNFTTFAKVLQYDPWRMESE